MASPTNNAGSGQVIAVVDAYHDPNALSDLNVFDSEYGYPTLSSCPMTPPFTATTGACFCQEDPQGTSHPSQNTLADWVLEESLDIEWAHAEAPGATIVLVEAKTNSTANLMSAVGWANDNGATEVSMSWDSAEFSTETTYDSYFDADSTSTGTPILYVASDGDSGHAAGYPAASPNVIAVGGTTLNGCSNTSCADFSSETAWSDSGGGVSQYEKIPSSQSSYTGPVYSESSGGISALSGSMRAVPDVSFDANPNTGVSVYDSTFYDCDGDCSPESGWFTLGGTSVGSPNWAGILAVGASSATALQGSKAIYSSGYTSNLRDITSGTNGSCGTDCTAGTGYDLVTGLGSPIDYPPAPSGPVEDGSPVSITDQGGNGDWAGEISTSYPYDLIVVAVDTDGPMSFQQSATVSGGGLTWTRAAQAQNDVGTPGDAAVWYASTNGTVLSDTTIWVSLASYCCNYVGHSYLESSTVIAYENATIGATASAVEEYSSDPSLTVDTGSAYNVVVAAGFASNSSASSGVPAASGDTIFEGTQQYFGTDWGWGYQDLWQEHSGINAAGDASIGLSTSAYPWNMAAVEVDG